MTERGLLDFIIARLPELSFQEKIILCEAFDTEEDLIQKSKADIEHITGRKLAAWCDMDMIRMLAERDAKAAAQRRINWVAWHSPAYPPMLREIYDPPPLLYFRGSLPHPELPLAAIVGTRKPSPQASAQAFDIAKGLGRGGVSVVSGLATGIDAMAHRGNIEGGAATVAVLGSGVDEVFPASNRPLARRILENGGALISEYPPGTGPRKWNFPARNRIISGLSRGVLVAEAPRKSGALITARFALEQNRELWVASAGSDSSASPFDRLGSARLAGDGAGIIRAASDILEAWGIELPAAEAETAGGGAGLAASLAHTLGITL